MRRAVLAVAAGLLAATGCSTGTDAVAQGGTFEFVSPGGQTSFTYPESERGTIGNLTGPDLLDTAATISLDDFAGEVVVLNVWGQWCPPCRAEADDLQQVYTDTQDLGVTFLGVNVRDPDISAPQDFVRDRGITYPSIYDPSYRSLLALGSEYPVSTTPSTVVLDRQHRVAAIFLTDLLAADLQPVVEQVAAEQARGGQPS